MNEVKWIYTDKHSKRKNVTQKHSFTCKTAQHVLLQCFKGDQEGRQLWLITQLIPQFFFPLVEYPLTYRRFIKRDLQNIAYFFCWRSLLICKWLFRAMRFCSCSSITCLRRLVIKRECRFNPVFKVASTSIMLHGYQTIDKFLIAFLFFTT